MPIPKVLPMDSKKSKDSSDGKKPSQQSSVTPKLLVNRYSIAKQLGCGNFGTVFLAQDVQNNNEKYVCMQSPCIKKLGTCLARSSHTIDGHTI